MQPVVLEQPGFVEARLGRDTVAEQSRFGGLMLSEASAGGQGADPVLVGAICSDRSGGGSVSEREGQYQRGDRCGDQCQANGRSSWPPEIR